MPRARAQEFATQIVFNNVDETAAQNNAAKGTLQIQADDIGPLDLRAPNLCKHLCRVIDCRYSMAEPQKRMRNSPNASAQLQYVGVRGDGTVNDLCLTSTGEQLIQFDRRPVRGMSAGTRGPVLIHVRESSRRLQWSAAWPALVSAPQR